MATVKCKFYVSMRDKNGERADIIRAQDFSIMRIIEDIEIDTATDIVQDINRYIQSGDYEKNQNDNNR